MFTIMNEDIIFELQMQVSGLISHLRVISVQTSSRELRIHPIKNTTRAIYTIFHRARAMQINR